LGLTRNNLPGCWRGASSHRFAVALVLGLVVTLLAGCTGGGLPPVSDRSRATGLARAPGEYVVVAGDTLYSIAWRHQRDFRTLAAINKIRKPYDIYPGQRLRIRGSATVTAPKVASKPRATSAAAAVTKPHPLSRTQTKPQTQAQSPRPAAPKTPTKTPTKTAPTVTKPAATIPRTGPVKLAWPSNGTRVKEFGVQPEGAQMPSRSIDFLLQPGASIRAAAAGEVVYVGRGLAGFEQFVIVKHNDTWLSAYGFNAIAGVREKQLLASNAVLARVTARASVASERDRQLHFEVRKNGTPVNPATVIK